MERYVAVNIAVRLPADVEALCRRLNTAQGADSFSDFGKSNNYPHITLAMAVFPYAKWSDVCLAVGDATREDCPLELEITELYSKVSPQIGTEYQLRVSKTSQIVELHTRIMGAIKPYRASVPASQKMFHIDPDEVWEPNTAHWVDRFKDKTPETYNPHISLKCRNVSALEGDLQFPMRFSARRIMIGYVGNYCTVRQLREEIPLLCVPVP